MLTRRDLTTFASIVALGALSTAAWLGEVVLVKGRVGLAWLDGYPYASFVAIACVVLSVVLPVRASRQIEPGRIVAFFVLAGLLSLVSFVMSRAAIYDLHSRASALLDGATSLRVPRDAAVLVGAAIVTAVGFTAAGRVLLAPVSWWLSAVFLAALALVLPVSILTIHVVPSFNGHTDYFQVVKMGYPVFWTNVLMGLASWSCWRGARPPQGERRGRVDP